MAPTAAMSASVQPAPDLSAKHLTARARAALAENTGVTAAAYLALVGVTGAGELWVLFGGRESPALYLAAGLATPAMTVGWYRVLLRSLRGEAAAFADVFSGFEVFWRALGVYTAFTLAVLLGLAAFVVPGIVAALALWPALFLLADRRADSVMAALSGAAALTRGRRVALLGIALYLVLLLFVGLLVFVVGVFIAASVATVIMAAAYDELAAHADAEGRPRDFTRPVLARSGSAR